MPEFSTQLLAYGFVWYVAFLFSTTCHEAAHALVAKLGGDETAALGGQVTLNPVPHIQREPWGMVVIPILSFIFTHGMIGWASAPFDPQWERRHPRRAALMALAGPATNYTLMLLAVIGLRVGSAAGWLHLDPNGQPGFALVTLLAFFSLNLLLGTFNLLPVPPLDGSSVIMLLMPEALALRYLDFVQGGNYMFIGLLIAWKAYDYVFDSIFRLGLRLLYPGSHYS